MAPPPRLVATFPSSDGFLAAFDTEVTKGGLIARGATLPNAVAMAECTLEVQVAGATVATIGARVATVVPGLGVAVVFAGVPRELAAYAERIRSTHPAAQSARAAPQVVEDAVEPELSEEELAGPTEEPPPPPEGEEERSGSGTAAERLAGLTIAQKMQAALSGDRSIRLQILRDPIRTLHLYALKNPRIGLDEVTWAAKQPSLSPDALKFIAEHTVWGSNSVICSALVQNPRTPIPIALRLLPKIPTSEIRQIAKGRGRAQIVQAARKIVIPS